MLVREILQGADEWFGEFIYLYGRQSDAIAFKLTEDMDKIHYFFIWDLADMLKLVSSKTKDDIEVLDFVQGVTLRWDGASDEFQVIRSEDELDFSFSYSLSSVIEWLRLAKRTMIERDILNGQSFGEILTLPEGLRQQGYYGAEEYVEERRGKQWVR